MNEVEIRVKADDDTGRGFASARKNADNLHDRVRKLTVGLDLMKTVAVGLGPALVPVLALSTAAAVGMGTALAGAGSAVGVFGAVTKTAFTEVKEASDKTSDLRDKMRLLREQIKITPSDENRKAYMKSLSKATDEYNARLALLPPTTRNVVRAYDKMGDSWQSFVDKNKPSVYGIMSAGFVTISRHVKDLQPLFDTGAQFAAKWVASINAWADSGGLKDLVTFLDAQAGPALDRLTNIFTNLVTAGGNLAQAAVFSEKGGFLGFLERGSAALASWTSSNGLTNLMNYLSENGPVVIQTLKDFTGAAVTIAQALGPLAPISLAIADALAKIIAATPPDVITALAGAYIALSVGIRLAATAQAILNIAMDANPIGAVILAIVGLVAVFFLVKAHALGVANAMFKVWQMIKNAFLSGVSFVIGLIGKFLDVISEFISFMAKIPGPIGAPFRALQGPVETAKAKVNALKASIDALKSKKISISTTFEEIHVNKTINEGGGRRRKGVAFQAHGGITGAAGGGPRSRTTMVGEDGPELVDLPPGTTVRSNPDTRRLMSGGNGVAHVVLEINSAGSKLDDAIVEIIRKAVRVKGGGNVQVALGR